MLQLLLEKYGPTLRTWDLAHILGYESVKALQNAISAGTCPIPTYRSGKRRLADVRDVADYLDQARHRGTLEHAGRYNPPAA